MSMAVPTSLYSGVTQPDRGQIPAPPLPGWVSLDSLLGFIPSLHLYKSHMVGVRSQSYSKAASTEYELDTRNKIFNKS